MIIVFTKIGRYIDGKSKIKVKEAITKLGNTPQGQNLLKGLTRQDKQNLMDKIGKLSANNISKEMLLHQLKNPEVINKLSTILNKKG